MKRLLVSALIAVTPVLSFSQPADWSVIAANPEGFWYAVPKSLSPTSSGTYTMWAAKNLSQYYVEPQDPKARSIQILFEIDCYGNMLRIIRAVHWTGENATGNSRVLSGPPGPWDSSPRGSNNPMGKLLAYACKDR